MLSLFWLLALPLTEPSSERMRARDWVSLDVFHLSRTLPSLSRAVETPLNPGLRARYHHAWFGRSVTGGSSLQAGFTSFDQLFWSLSLGAGFEGVWRTDSGVYASLGLRLDYERLFTGNNHFELESGRYRQTTDPGRGFLRLTVADLTGGYSPKPLRELGLVPALRYAWVAQLPLYANEDANPWSYSEFGVTLLWAWRSRP